MRPAHLTGIAVGLVALFAVSMYTTRRASSFEECLLDIGRSRGASEARDICRRAFPTPRTEPPFFEGLYFYPTDGAECGDIAFQASGIIHPDYRGYCGEGSRIECTSGDCRFTCLRFAGSDTSIIRSVRNADAGLVLGEDPTGLDPMDRMRRAVRADTTAYGQYLRNVVRLSESEILLHRDLATCEAVQKVIRANQPPGR